MSWTDSHCHLQDEDNPLATALRAARAGVDRLVCVGTTARDSRRAAFLAKSISNGTAGDEVQVWATAGLHPHHASDGVGAVELVLGELGEQERERVVAVGECGLDYHYEHSPRDSQREAFSAQIDLALRSDLALVVHTRDAWDDTLELLSSGPRLPRTIIHCFTGGPAEAERCLELGAWLSFSGIATFSNAPEIREAAALCPLDRMLVETDSPYLAPVPHRGIQNEPAFVTFVGAVVAKAKGVTPEELAVVTSHNATEVFRLPGT